MTETSRTADGRVVVVTGANGAAGRAVTERLAAGGARVVAAGRTVRQWDSPRIAPAAVDLLDPDATRRFADAVTAEHGRVDGLVHLVGGWRGAPSFAATDLADWTFLHDQVVRTLQHTTLAFHDALRDAPSGRFAMVSQPAARRPDAGSAAYGAAKAAAETWTLAMAASFASADGSGTGSAATILVVKALVSEAKPGLTHVDDLASTVAGLWDRPASELNGTRLDLS
ncbi:SDR family NAD(P)-dependent oxidoreductase [Actinomadura logoneensis]|uniref:SDR family NAD(P)-dependent oxidoreductase n=1 Tax=Actinomadura logoneensis TaxID=2293572 RepID=A0A372JCL1_9ACTN|nr:SDR family NAD(P)-dependent oxidoreductase [Actinomadura logoneensis]RFU37751.1 SDR family NAD(P)-dependent oxidoreductase [Actinomadura logoneensis]